MAGAAALLLLLISASSTAGTDPSMIKKSKSPPSSTPPPSLPELDKPSSAVFPLHGNVYPLGLYFTSVHIGDPPQPYFLDVDTGSDLTWVQCDAPCVRCSKGPHPWYKPRKNGVVPCEEEVCVWLRLALDVNEECREQCDYEIKYADHGSSLGVLLADRVSIRLTNGTSITPRIVFGCGYDQEGAEVEKSSHTDGVLGLGNGQSSLISQLRQWGVTRNVVGHCLSREKGGYLFFGDDLVASSGVTWIPMSHILSKNYYSPGKAAFFLGKHSFASEEPVVFDSGSSYTYFTDKPYQAFLSQLKKDLSKKPLEEVSDPDLPICWKGAKPFKSLADVKKFFRSIVLNFARGRKSIQMEIPFENYLIVTKYGNVCSGILNGTEVGLKDLNIIGDISLQDLMVIYDNEEQQIGWSKMNCDRIPNVDDLEGVRQGFISPDISSLIFA